MKLPFETTDEQMVRLARIAVQMSDAGLETSFIASAMRLAAVDQGVFDLMELWNSAYDDEAGSRDDHRNECIADIQEALDDEEQPTAVPQERPKVKFEDLDRMVQVIGTHKDRLRKLIDASGGVSDVARKAGIPQPSLSRMLSSASMPRKSTLYKIATALQVDESQVAGEFVR